MINVTDEEKQVVRFEMEYLDFDYNKRTMKGSYRKIIKLQIEVVKTDY